MQLWKKSDSSSDNSTHSSPTNPDLDSPAIPENDNDLLSPNPELATDKSQKKKKGFPVFGCLSIFFGLGILGVLALPSFLSCGSSARQAQAKTYVGSMNRAQQAYIFENEAFTNSFGDLGLGIATQTDSYQYSTRATKTAAFNYGITRQFYKTERFGPFQWQTQTNSPLKSYVGGVFLAPASKVDPKADKKEMIALAIMCESVTPGTTKPAEPILKNYVPTCGTGTKDLRSKIAL